MKGETPELGLIGLGGNHELPPALYGSKAAELARMSALGLPVPPAFALSANLCAPILAGEKQAFDLLRAGLAEGVGLLESATGRRLGDAREPLFVSVRSGAEKSMPGMLETILDVGMNPTSAHGLIRATGNPRLAFDSHRRFIQIYAQVVGGMVAQPFEEALARMMRAEDAAHEGELDPEALERLAGEFLALAAAEEAAPPPDPVAQLFFAARAVYLSWQSPRAILYRKMNGLENLLGTAVTIQTMVFGNSGGASGSGVAFSRDPATGAKQLYADFLFDAQGEDVVSGRRTPVDAGALKRRLPEVAAQLAAGAETLEKDRRDVQDVEFTVENGKLFFLQTRSAKRTPRAALKIAVDLATEGLIDKSEALRRVTDVDLTKAGRAAFVQAAPAVARATVAAPGVACGRACFTSAQAEEVARRGEKAILIRRDTSTEDVAGFAAADGILTAIGGRTSHAAVVARQMGKACLVGCATLSIDPDDRAAALGEKRLRQGDWIALDGTTGEISLGQRDIAIAEAKESAILRHWRDEDARRR
ncbi:pyruvate, phosphate dikinase [Rhodoblastus acidophilus]|uniref:Pyruvate, phosphate dikinase n=1 Tax=Candidatus Rhodoblastus alkanivorans TaxID=2954117 RepID=A0ABS9Z7S0_9HYPH|nr:pyruvate, phosphate dikinase [Candidatus Rhodoblastus alkanivorans]MCI4678378.1 pyruvate, phosphate dikinase [Candidatus Rhodoblastus alkanivorans]MCI4683636.1 pyruvate, phosphate dikinase [Candidatus Rhodoblastus alkanivorans]MDI4640952.1 pyruvate, phosphate dikinase [Rhodoblastus acidophilus]